MIIHTIIKHRPQIKAVVDTAPAQNSNTYLGWVSNKKLKNKEEFDVWLANHPYKVGALLALDPNEVTDLSQVHMVVAISTDYALMDWDRASQLPKCFRMKQIKAVIPTMGTWERWDSPAGYRLLTEKEINFYLENHNDSIQDCLKLCSGPATGFPRKSETK